MARRLNRRELVILLTAAQREIQQGLRAHDRGRTDLLVTAAERAQRICSHAIATDEPASKLELERLPRF